MKERARMEALRAEIVERIDGAIVGDDIEQGARIAIVPRDRAHIFPNQILATYDGREYLIAITENRKSRLK